MTHSRKKINIDMVAFRRDVEDGDTVLVLSEKYGIAKSTVWRLKAQISGKLGRREAVPVNSDEEAPEEWDLSLTVSTDRLTALLADTSAAEIQAAIELLDPQFKANLFTAVLQARLNDKPAPGEENA